MHQISIVVFIIVMILRCNASENSKVPQSFGLQVTTHNHPNGLPQFQLFVSHYASMQCQILSDITIIWYQEQSPQQLKILSESGSWNRPVYFQIAPSNSVNWNFKTSPKSQAKVYFYINGDTTIDCQQLSKGFKIWQNYAIQQIGPLVSYIAGVFEYSNQGGFTEIINSQKQFFSVALRGAGFISRHFMQLYFTNTWELQRMRQYVNQINSCEDVALEWLVQYYYPQLNNVLLPSKFYTDSLTISQQTASLNKGRCIQKFTRIFGINPLRYSPIIYDYANQVRIFALQNQSVLAKKQYLDKYLIVNDQSSPAVNKQEFQNKLASAAQALKETQKYSQRLEESVQKCRKSLNYLEKVAEPHDPLSASSHHKQIITQLTQQLSRTVFIQIGLVSIILILLWKLMVHQKEPSQESFPLSLSQESEIIIINPPDNQCERINQ